MSKKNRTVAQVADMRCLKSKYGCKIPKVQREESEEDKDHRWYNERAIEDAAINASETEYETGPEVDKEHKWYNDRAIEEAQEMYEQRQSGRNPSSAKMPKQTTQYGSKVVEPKDKSLPIIKISDKIKLIKEDPELLKKYKGGKK